MTDLRRLASSALVLLVALAPGAIAAQSGTVRQSENLRSTPNGDVIGRVDRGLALSRVGTNGDWIEVDVEGWIWLRSLQTSKVGGHDLIVSADEGENLRATPSGTILGKFPKGTLFDEKSREPGWVRVRRRGWIWAASVDTAVGKAAVASSAARPAVPAPSPARPKTAGATGASVEPVPARGPTTATAKPTPTPPPPVSFGRGGKGPAILASPAGDTIARVSAGAQLQVLARQGSWARVRVEGWAWLPDDSASDLTPVTATPADLAAQPDRYRGRVVAWDLQFLSLEKAEKIRTEFFEGEPFLLTRYPAGAYVYVAVPPDRIGAARNLLPLERIHVVGRVRAPASVLTGSPILDLIELSSTRDRK